VEAAVISILYVEQELDRDEVLKAVMDVVREHGWEQYGASSLFRTIRCQLTF
jgi:hypothetical protein